MLKFYIAGLSLYGKNPGKDHRPMSNHTNRYNIPIRIKPWESITPTAFNDMDFYPYYV